MCKEHLQWGRCSRYRDTTVRNTPPPVIALSSGKHGRSWQHKPGNLVASTTEFNEPHTVTESGRCTCCEACLWRQGWVGGFDILVLPRDNKFLWGFIIFHCFIVWAVALKKSNAKYGLSARQGNKVIKMQRKKCRRSAQLWESDREKNGVKTESETKANSQQTLRGPRKSVVCHYHHHHYHHPHGGYNHFPFSFSYPNATCRNITCNCWRILLSPSASFE